MSRADLHVHTFYSDGSESPRQVLEMAKAAGLAAIAITDHDILEAHVEAAPIAKELGIELIPGLEMSSSTPDDRDVHVLGFYIDLGCQPFQEMLATMRAQRVKRMHRMIERLQELGLAITIEDVMKAAGKGTMGRPHVAQAMVDRGHVATLREAFDRYLGGNGPAYIPGSTVLPGDAIRAIRQAGGIPVLAHPIYVKDDTLIEQFQRDGLVGLEVYHYSHGPDVIQRYEKIADRLGLLKTGGSDYHGNAKEGVTVGGASVPYAMVDALKKWKQDHASPSTR